jgi:hypothetical protein
VALHGGDHAELLEARELLGIDQLQVADAVWYRRRALLAGVLHGIQRLTHGPVADRMHVHYPATFLGGRHQRAETLGIDQQLTLLVAVGVRVDYRSGLPRVLEDTVDEHLEAGEAQVGYAGELAHHVGLHREVVGFALRVGQQQGGHVHVQLAFLGQRAVQG